MWFFCMGKSVLKPTIFMTVAADAFLDLFTQNVDSKYGYSQTRKCDDSSRITCGYSKSQMRQF